jgi:OOP family OmpA-OmpF porin
MSVIGKQVKSNSLGLSGLASLLIGQKDDVKAAMPASLSDISDMLNFNK